jgi:hypothetical protein
MISGVPQPIAITRLLDRRPTPNHRVNIRTSAALGTEYVKTMRGLTNAKMVRDRAITIPRGIAITIARARPTDQRSADAPRLETNAVSTQRLGRIGSTVDSGGSTVLRTTPSRGNNSQAANTTSKVTSGTTT